MKKLKLLLVCCAVFCCVAIQANVQIGDLYYSLDSITKTATLVKSDTYKSLTSLSVPGTIASGGENYAVTSIRDSAFYECSNLTAVNIPSSVLKVGNFAFFKCSGLTTLNVASKITGTCSFACCTSLTTITIASTVTRIGNGAFYGNTLLTSIIIPASVTSIGTNPFTLMPNFKSILVDEQNPNYSSENGVLYNKDKSALIAYPYAASGEIKILPSVTSIEAFALQGNPNLKTLTIPANISIIKIYAFDSCPNLTSVTIPSSVTSLEHHSFSYCGNLKTVTIPSNIVDKFNVSFSNCNNLDSVTVTSTSGTINMISTFNNFTSLHSVTLSPDIVSIGTNTFSGCTSLERLDVPAGVTKIGATAFYNCSGLKSVTIPTSVTSIGIKAFSGCTGLSSITLPYNLKNLNDSAFDGCTNLKKVNCVGTVPTTGTSVFNSNNLSTDTLCVESNYLEAYRDSTTWKDFGTIRAFTDNELSNYNTLAVNDTIGYPGVQMKLPIFINNIDSITAFQFDLYLPTGITVAKQDGSYLIDLGERTTLKNHSLLSALQSDGAIRVVAYSGNNTAFKDHSGAVAYITLNIADSVAEGSYPIIIKNMVLSSVNAVAYNATKIQSTLTVAKYLLGDANNNGIVNINDAVAIVNKLLGKASSRFLAKAADVDNDSTITINDVVQLINKYILNISASSVKARYASYASSNTATLNAQSFAIAAGEEKTLDIVLNNPSDPVTAFQFDVNLPKGFSIVKESDGNYSQLGEERNMTTHRLSSNLLQNGDLRVVCFSADNTAISGQSGSIATIRIKADADIPAGTYYLTLHNAILAHPDGLNAFSPAEIKSTISVGTTGIDGTAKDGLSITSGKGFITIKAATTQDVQIFSIDGMRLAAFTLQTGESRTLKTVAGLYIVNGKKIAVN